MAEDLHNIKNNKKGNSEANLDTGENSPADSKGNLNKDRDRYTYLAEKWLEGTLTVEEELEFNDWYHHQPSADHTDPANSTGTGDIIHIDPDYALSEDQLKSKLLQQIQEQANLPKGNEQQEKTALNTYGKAQDSMDAEQEDKTGPSFPPKINHLPSKRVAALLLFFFGLSLITYYANHHKQAPTIALRHPAHKTDVLPGTEKAVLTLASGRRLLLDSTVHGLLATQGTLNITATGDGGLIYKPAGNHLRSEEQQDPLNPLIYNDTDKVGNNNNNLPQEARFEVQNTLSTPKGAVFHLTLADGTKVWLNAASSIRFPIRFTGHERRVKIKGEAYFEVAKNAAKPFKVTVDNMEVKVLGTHFNINAYKDAATINTTLLEGAVQVQDLTTGNTKNIVPGEEAKLYPSDKIKIGTANTEMAIAWKNKLFQFEKADLHTLLNEVARWYNIQVVWTRSGGGSPDLFTGTIPRNLKLSELLSVLDYSNVKFKLEDNKLRVFN